MPPIVVLGTLGANVAIKLQSGLYQIVPFRFGTHFLGFEPRGGNAAQLQFLSNYSAYLGERQHRQQRQLSSGAIEPLDFWLFAGAGTRDNTKKPHEAFLKKFLLAGRPGHATMVERSLL